jgi:tRNA threonylcarbamoyl adenosine modification protein YeaZ
MPNYNLCIDTSSGTTVAVLRGGEVLAELTFEENMKHAERIGEAIAQVVAAAEIRPNRISSVVVGRGPAPFTGLRIGVAAAIMFAEAVGAKLFGVVSLDAIARTALENGAGPVLVTADARRSEVYWAVYSGLSANGAPEMIEGPGVCKPAELDAKFADKNYARTDAKISAAALGKVFEAQLIDGTSTHDVTALYLREADAVAPKDLREAGKKVSG